MKVSRSTKIIVLTMLLFIVVLVVFVFIIQQRKDQVAIEASTAAHSLQNATGTGYQTLSGQPVALTEHLGKVIVVYSWASWCPQCMDELTQVAALAEQYEQDDVVVLAINRSDNPEQAKRFLAETIGTETKVQLVLDADDYFFTSLEGYSMPETVVFSQTGAVFARYRQNFRLPIVSAAVSTVLNEDQSE